MSAKNSKSKADRETDTSGGMEGWKGLHVGYVACHRDKKAHAKWRKGRKKGLRRARRRRSKEIITEADAEKLRGEPADLVVLVPVEIEER